MPPDLPVDAMWTPSIAARRGMIITADDSLRFTSFNSAAGVTLTLEGRFVHPDGRVNRIAESHTPSTDRTAVTSLIRLADGALLNVSVRASAGTPRRGQCFVLVELVQGRGAIVVASAALLQDYVTDTGRLAWPGSALRSSIEGPGVLRSVTGTDPAANTEIAETVPTNARWRIHAIQLALVTDGTAANREVSLVFDDGTTVFARVPTGTNHTASLTRTYSAFDHSPRNTIAQDATLNFPLPRIDLQGGHRIRTVTTNIQAGDNYGAPQLLVEEWIED